MTEADLQCLSFWSLQNAQKQTAHVFCFQCQSKNVLPQAMSWGSFFSPSISGSPLSNAWMTGGMFLFLASLKSTNLYWMSFFLRLFKLHEDAVSCSLSSALVSKSSPLRLYVLWPFLSFLRYPAPVLVCLKSNGSAACAGVFSLRGHLMSFRALVGGVGYHHHATMPGIVAARANHRVIVRHLLYDRQALARMSDATGQCHLW